MFGRAELCVLGKSPTCPSYPFHQMIYIFPNIPNITPGYLRAFGHEAITHLGGYTNLRIHKRKPFRFSPMEGSVVDRKNLRGACGSARWSQRGDDRHMPCVADRHHSQIHNEALATITREDFQHKASVVLIKHHYSSNSGNNISHTQPPQSRSTTIN